MRQRISGTLLSIVISCFRLERTPRTAFPACILCPPIFTNIVHLSPTPVGGVRGKRGKCFISGGGVPR